MKKHGGIKNGSTTQKLLIILMSVIITVALAITCAFCFDAAKPVTVNEADDGGISTSATFTPTKHVTNANSIVYVSNPNNSGTYIANGDIIEMAYGGTKGTDKSWYEFVLPKGYYKLEVWGAQGGYKSSGTGGKGGYAVGLYQITASSQRMYVTVGGCPGNTTSAGYNGGGAAGGSAGGGGGATHIATGVGTSTNNDTKRLLSNISTKQSSILIVAGGGGGAQKGDGAAGGGLNGSTAVLGSNSKLYGTPGGGGSQTAGGTGGKAGSFGQGGAGTQGGDKLYGGGGGGGWYGGGGAKSDGSLVDDYGGGGGSGYYGGVTSGTVNGITVTKSMVNGSRTSHGLARITVLGVNLNPVANPTSGYDSRLIASNTYRGTNKAIYINSGDIAKDPEGGSVYFTNGSSSNYDNYTSTGLYLNSACTTSASAYLDCTIISNTQIKVTAIKKYPRLNVDGCTVNGRFTLYAKIRDAFVGKTTTRGYAVIKFYLTVLDGAISVTTTDNNTLGTDKNIGGAYVEYSYGSGTNAYVYRLGASSKTTTRYDYVLNGYIYNTATNKKTVFIPTPLTLDKKNGFTVYAKDLYTEYDSSYDVVGIRSVGTSSYTSYYTTTLNTNTSKFGTTGLADSITIKPTSITPSGGAYVCLLLTAASCETASKAIIGSNNTELTLVFKLANTRPYYATSNSYSTGLSEPSVSITTGSTKDIKVTDFIKDADGHSLTYATSGSYIKLPTYEYVSVTKENTLVPIKSGSNYYTYNNTSNTSEFTTVGSGKTAKNANAYTTGEGSTATGFAGKTGVLAAVGTSAASSACVTYQYVNSTTLRFTARAATQYLYSGSGRKGHFYVMVRVVDAGDPNDTGIWYPIWIQVNSAAPREPSTPANFTLSFGNYNAGSENGDASHDEDVDTAIYLTPISYTNTGGVLKGVGAVSHGDYKTENKMVSPIATDNDVFPYRPSGVDSCTNKLNDVIALNGNTMGNGTSYTVNRYETTPFFNVEIIDLYAADTVFSNLTDAQKSSIGAVKATEHGNDVYKFKGLKITPVRSTDSAYYQIDVKLKDAHGSTGTVRVYIRVNNRSVNVRRNEQTGTKYPVNTTGVGVCESSSLITGSSTFENYVNYTIKVGETVKISPYDLVYDFDTADGLNPVTDAGGRTVTYNTNPDDAGFATTATAINKTYAVKRTTSPTVAATSTNVTLGKLSYTNEQSLTTSAAQYAGYFSLGFVTERSIRCISFTAVSRTRGVTPTLKFTVGDGYTSVECAIVITIVNSGPILQDGVADACYKLTAGTANTASGAVNRREFTASMLAQDKDKDNLTYIAGSARIVAEVDGKYYDKLYYSSAKNAYVGTETEDGPYVLSDYVDVALTKGTGIYIGMDVLRIIGLSSTQLFGKPIYLEFGVTDGYGGGAIDSTLRARVEVINSAPEFCSKIVINDRGDESENFTPFEYDYNANGVETHLSGYSWDIEYQYAAEKKIARYLVNCEELYNSTIIPASASNKKLLFNEPDKQQYTLLNGTLGVVGNIVNATRMSKDVAPGSIGATQMGSSSVAYTATYNAGKESAKFMTITVEFFKKNDDGTFGATSDQTSKYWAIKIVDDAEASEDAEPTQIAIAVKDNHHGKFVYSGLGLTEDTGKSDVRILNFYYRYQKLGITSMHTYYNTDGNAEAYNKVDGGSDRYVVDYRYVRGYQFENGTVPATQEALKSAAFTDKFKYQYFLNVQAAGENVTFLPHVYPDESKAFYYEPISLDAATYSNPKDMPISYIAMPQGYPDSGTEGGKHIIFGNAAVGNVAGYKLDDNGYADWDKKSAAVFENVSLSDGVETWRGDADPKSDSYIFNNPYIDIEYNGKIPVPGDDVTDSLVNRYRAKLNDAGNDHVQIGWKNGESAFREDKYGFKLAKKQNGKRTTGELTLTVSLRTSDPESQAQEISVKLLLPNNAPENIRYFDESINGNSETTAYMDLSVEMTLGDTNGKYIELVRGARENSGLKSAPYLGNKYTITYDDPDSTDTLKFFMASAYDKPLGEVLNAAQSARINETNCLALESYERYVGKTSHSDVVNVATIVPNPGYDKFFTVSPQPGAPDADLLQIIPKAKTALNIPDDADEQAYLDANCLKKDGKGIYYPFKILLYDELNGSGFENGYYILAQIKVYIGNDPLKLIDDKGDKYKHGSDEFAMQSLTLTKSATNAVNVTSVLADNDIVLQDGLLGVQSSDAWQELVAAGGTEKDVEKNQTLVKDYLVMPALTDGVPAFEVLAGRNDNSSPLPVGVTVNADSPTTLVFSVDSAFNNPIALKFIFEDSAGSQVPMVFYLTYENEAPKANADTFKSGDNKISVVMKYGDSFTLHVADANTFENDKIGGYKSPTYFNSALTSKLINYPTGEDNTARKMYERFEESGLFTKETYPEDRAAGSLGAIIVGDDDAPSTLRFVTRTENNKRYVGTFSDNMGSQFTVSATNALRTESSATDLRCMSVTVTANGYADDVDYTVDISDGNKQISVVINISVLPTAPTEKSDADLAKLGITRVTDDAGEKIPHTYAINLGYGGAAFDKPLNAFMSDIDKNDDQTLSVAEVYEGTDPRFKVENSDGVDVSAVAVSMVKPGDDNDKNRTTNCLRIQATDFIPIAGGYSTVKFRVEDAHGARSEEISIRVYVTPESIKSNATSAKHATVEVKSFAEYIADNGAPVTVDIVSPAESTKFVYDKDVAAPSAKYDVAVYALLKKDDKSPTGFNESTVSAISQNLDDFLIVKRVQRHGELNPAEYKSGAGQDVYEYVARFFSVDISENGKALTFTPNSATVLDTTGAVGKIKFYIVVGKLYTSGDEADTKYTVGTLAGNGAVATENVNAFVDVSVKNSDPIAVASSPLNYGYPLVKKNEAGNTVGAVEEDGERRQSQFLEFTGKAGDSLTWRLFNEDPELDENYGLFYDYDMLNAKVDTPDNGRKYLTQESLTCVTAKVLKKYADGKDVPADAYAEGNDRVLDITIGTDGTVTVKINRKVKTGQPPDAGSPETTDIPIEITCADTVGYNNAAKKTVSTIVTVRVQNDDPEFKKSVSDKLSYTVAYSETDGYELFASIPTNKSLSIKVEDIVDDADIKMDAYYLDSTGSNDSLTNSTSVIGSLFKFEKVIDTNGYGISTMTALKFTCTSANRGATATCELQLKDSTKKRSTSKMTIYLTVGNTAPVQIADKTEITVMGLGPDVNVDDYDEATGTSPAIVFTDNIVNYVTDINPKDAVVINNPESPTSRTFVCIESITVRTSESPIDPPFVYGPNSQVEGENGEPRDVSYVCSIIWTENETHQNFAIMLMPGVYGTQKVILTVSDSGYGYNAADRLSSNIELTITVARPIDDFEKPKFSIANKVTRTVTPKDILLTAEASGDEKEQHNIDGYEISDIRVQTQSGLDYENSALKITAPTAPAAQTSGVVSSAYASADETDGKWKITAKNREADAKMTVTFAVGDELYNYEMLVDITENHAPKLNDNDERGIFHSEQLTANKTITITPDMWFTDEDVGDVMQFVSPLKVKVAAYAGAYMDGGNIVLEFKGRGTTELTFNITDATHTLYTHTITIGCTDIEELSFFNKAIAIVQADPLMYGLIAGGVLLFIIILIIIIVVVHKKKKMRREIEMLLNSEAELEQEMLRISGTTRYQSYGYLPPTATVMNDPGMMLGSGANNPAPNNLQLNAGGGQSPQNAQGYPNTNPSAPSGQTNSFGVRPNDGFDPNDF